MIKYLKLQDTIIGPFEYIDFRRPYIRVKEHALFLDQLEALGFEIIDGLFLKDGIDTQGDWAND